MGREKYVGVGAVILIGEQTRDAGVSGVGPTAKPNYLDIRWVDVDTIDIKADAHRSFADREDGPAAWVSVADIGRVDANVRHAPRPQPIDYYLCRSFYKRLTQDADHIVTPSRVATAGYATISNLVKHQVAMKKLFVG